VRDVEPLYRPEVGTYLANQRQAAAMFVHSLHDRLGENGWPQRGDVAEEMIHASAWMRVVGSDGRTRSRDRAFDIDTDATLVQAGGDVGRWQVDHGQGTLHLGGMLGHGTASNHASAAGNPARSRGRTEGWSLGAYTTWYATGPGAAGLYLDGWVNHGRYRNTVQGDGLPDVRYDAHTWALSVEAGYALRLGEGSDGFVEPQLQLVYLDYQGDESTEVNGTRVDSADGTGWVARLGLRTHRTWVSGEYRYQPYVTVNWWHDQVPDRLAFNGVQLGDLYPGNRYELKLGLNVGWGRDWNAWANVGYQQGGQHYTESILRIGARYRW